MYKRQLVSLLGFGLDVGLSAIFYTPGKGFTLWHDWLLENCLLYTSDAADERSSVDLGGRRIIKKKT